MKSIDYEVRHEQPDNPYSGQLQSKAVKGFALAFKLVIAGKLSLPTITRGAAQLASR